MKKTTFTLAITLATIIISAPAVAGKKIVAPSKSGVIINGNAKQTISTKNNTNMAVGKNAHAKQEIGAIKGNVKINGNLKQTISTKNNTNMAVGKNAKATQSIGTIGSN